MNTLNENEQAFIEVMHIAMASALQSTTEEPRFRACLVLTELVAEMARDMGIRLSVLTECLVQILGDQQKWYTEVSETKD